MTRRAYFETPQARRPTQRFHLWESIRCAQLRALDEPRTPCRTATHARCYAGYPSASYFPIKH